MMIRSGARAWFMFSYMHLCWWNNVCVLDAVGVIVSCLDLDQFPFTPKGPEGAFLSLWPLSKESWSASQRAVESHIYKMFFVPVGGLL